MNIYINILLYIYIQSLFLISSISHNAELDILDEEEKEFQHDHITAAKAIDYTLYFSSHHFDLMNEDDWDKYKISTRNIDSKQENANSIEDDILQQERSSLLNLENDDDDDDDNDDSDKIDDYYQENDNIEETMKHALFHGHRLLLNELDGDEDKEEYDDYYYNDMNYDEYSSDSDYYDALYYNYYIEDESGSAQLLDEINACSAEIEALNDRRLCVHWHHENGLKLGITDNANEAPNDMMMMEFNNDDHWNRIEMVDNLNKAAARGIVYIFVFFNRLSLHT